MTKGYIDRRKEVQEKDEKSSHQRKLNYKNTKTRKYTVKTNKLSRLDQPFGITHR